MLKLEDLKKDAQVRGLEGDQVVRIVLAEPVGADTAPLTRFRLTNQSRSFYTDNRPNLSKSPP
jgi:hypothetical protein